MTVETFLRLSKVEARTGVKRTFIHEGMKAGTFPKSVKIGNRAVAWVASEIDAWIEEQIAKRDGK